MPRFFALSPNSPRASLSSNPATLSARSSRRPTPDLAASAEALRARLGPAAILSSTSSTASLGPAAASRSASVDVQAPAPQLSLGLGDLSLGGLDDALLALHLDNVEDTSSWNPPAFYGQDSAREAPMRPSTSSARPSADRVSSPRTSPVLRSPLPFPTLPPLSPLPPSPFPAAAPVSSPRRTRREPSPVVRARNITQPRSMSSDLPSPRRPAAPAADAPPRLSRQRSQSENAASIASDLDRLALQLSLGFSDPPALHLALPNAPPPRTRSPAPPATRTSTSTRPLEAPIPLALPLLDLALPLSPPPPLTPQLADRRADSGSDVADARPPSRPRIFLRPPIDHPARTSASAPPLSNTSDPRDLPVLPTLAPRLSDAGDAERRPSIRVPQVRPRDRAPPPTRPSLDPDATSPPAPPVSRPSVSTTPAPLPLELPHLDTDLVRRRQSRLLAPVAAGDSGAPAISDMDDFDDGDSIARDVRILARDPAPPYRDPAAPFLLELDAYGRPRTTPTLVPDLDVTQAIISLMQLHYIPPAAGGGAAAAAPSRRSVHLPTLLAQAAAPAPGMDDTAGNAWTLLGHESVKDKAYVCFNGSHLATLVLGDPERRAPTESSAEPAAESSMPMASVLPLIPRGGFLFEHLSLDQKPTKPAEPEVTFYLAVENRTISMSPTERACARQIIDYVNAERARLGFPDAPGPAPPLDADDGSTLVGANASPRHALRPAPRDASLHISIPRHMQPLTGNAPQTPPPNYDDLDGPGGSRSPPWRRRSRGRRIEAMAGPRQVARSASRRSSVYSRRSTASSVTGGGSPRPRARSPVASAVQEHRRSMPPPARWSMVETAAEPMHLVSAADGVEGDSGEAGTLRPWVVSSFSDVGVSTDAPGEPAPAPTRRDVDLRVAPWEAVMPPMPMPMPPVPPVPAEDAVALDATAGAPRDRTSRAFMPARSPFRAPATLSGAAADDTSALSPMLSPLSLSGTFPSSVPQTTRAFSPSPRPRADVPLHRTASPPGRRGTNTAPTPRGASKFFRRMLSVLEGASPPPPPPPAAAPAPAAPASDADPVPAAPLLPALDVGEPLLHVDTTLHVDAAHLLRARALPVPPIPRPGTPSDLASPGAWSLNGSTVVSAAAMSGVQPAARPSVSSVGRR
ncbi:hypothetical protein GGF32_004904 [Allomyces javanicus]|nr:hypothetical protein GGF32_004904 [Allomyces javanicus]